ncbi:hypothetical protein Cadr_000030783 [Camelus dromedarius]|uniref:Uncharacterized protein n=1 Tax=Camelus dromedarius TaxID=9838 RepID=A0A5N4BZD8_CAMDR|nr:hypothetical protein Cadr_000030783 [Camelus dromedarius]KAB1251987.1 hypothetical protein Cadr_000030783 [Camelus dromedarius]
MADAGRLRNRARVPLPWDRSTAAPEAGYRRGLCLRRRRRCLTAAAPKSPVPPCRPVERNGEDREGPHKRSRGWVVQRPDQDEKGQSPWTARFLSEEVEEKSISWSLSVA